MQDERVRRRILEWSGARFFASGYSKVTMDELAAELGMSKKTLYRYFPGKKALLRTVMLERVQEISRGVRRILQADEGEFTTRLRDVLMFIGAEMPRPGPAFMKDVQGCAADVWAEMDRLRSREVAANFGKLFQDGMREGCLPPDLDVDLTLRMLTTLIEGMVNPQVLSQVPLTGNQMLERVVRTLMFGVVTDRGRKSLPAERQA